MLSPNPLTYFAHVEADWADAFCRRHNDELAALVAEAPDRLAGFAQLPMQDPGARRRRAAPSGDASSACSAPYIGTDLGRPLDDPAFDEVWATCTELDVPLFIHPAPDGIDPPRRDERLARFDGDLWLGFCYEETLAVATLVLGGVLDRHPALDVCVSHGGGATSWLAERIEHAARTRPWASEHLRDDGRGRRPPRPACGGTRTSAGRGPCTRCSTAFGSDRVVAGTNLAGWDQSHDPSWGDADLAATFDANARRLLRIDLSRSRAAVEPLSPTTYCTAARSATIGRIRSAISAWCAAWSR